jgi:hypothetical protein
MDASVPAPQQILHRRRLGRPVGRPPLRSDGHFGLEDALGAQPGDKGGGGRVTRAVTRVW